MNTHRKQVKKTFWAGFWQGMAASCYVFAPPPSLKHNPPSCDLDAMREDWRRVGADFDTVIQKARKATHAAT